MTRYQGMLASLCVAAISLILLLVQAEGESGHGKTHPDFASMNQGGDVSRHEGKLILGWLFGSSQFVLYTLWLSTAVKGNKGSRLLNIVGLLTIAIYTLVLLSYRHALFGDAIIAGFPVVSTLAFYGVWLATGGFLVLYLVHYPNWIYGPKEAAQFEALLQAKSVEQSFSQPATSTTPNSSSEHG